MYPMPRVYVRIFFTKDFAVGYKVLPTNSRAFYLLKIAGS